MSMKKINKEKIILFLKILFPMILLVLAGYEIKKFTGNMNVQLFRHEVNQLHLAKMVLIFLITFCAIFPMFFYDVILVKILGFKMPIKELVKKSFIANTFSNLIGFGGLVGATLRTYFYHEAEADKKILVKKIASVSLFYLTGISLLAWTVLISYQRTPLLHDKKWLLWAVAVVGLYLPIFISIYFIQRKKRAESMIEFGMALKLIMVSLLEWIAIFLAIWLLCLILKISIDFAGLVSVLIVASCAGIISMIPGGLGSFDLVFIWGTHVLGVPEEQVVVLLLFYRIGYFILPFLLGLVLFIMDFWNRWNQSWNDVPNAILGRISHILLTFLVFLSGLVLLLSAAVPGIIGRLKIAQEFLSFPIMNISHQLSVATGFILLGLSRGIQYKEKRAYHLTLVVLIFAALFTFLKGFDYEEALYILIVVLLLSASKKRFYRERFVLNWGKTIFDIGMFVVITFMFVLIGYLNLPSSEIKMNPKLSPYLIKDYRDLFKSAGIGLVIAMFLFFFGYLFRRNRKWELKTSITQEEKIMDHLDHYNGTVLTHLIFLHDKFIYWNKKDNVMFAYQAYADKLVVLGDPIGDHDELPLAIEEFRETADLHGYTPVFYEVSEKMLPFLHENGYDFFKLGEEAYVDLEGFSFGGKKMKGARAVKNKFERENYQFEIVSPPFHADLMKELKDISDEWLQGRTEKGFSLGFFDETYLNKAEIAVVRANEVGILGFVSLMPVYDQNQTISLDMMRFKKDSPNGTMDFVFLSLFEWAKEQGYQSFIIGMAPLSNVGLSKFSFLSEKVASQIFLHGQFFYSFQGLRKFKDKYADMWLPKYLAFRRKSSLPITMTQITLLIGKKRPKSKQ
ncbi:lysylphosphatidylglycerol synthetase [Neobacillus bataviensis LMG 21833]|uniref:Phosphatidylglycerol lysyltransferase n=1 Tax=Neobacillus bataviensis LMG 21833 TaxID=1117379 RepID=K6DNQ9_9BACI|nr:bifunctional lysylphosphatidylglycerol flippase/synthetase MprF [Neobacillus bataviensis]EKN69813.1 lysylphosphatidylglycerol synthetase [Neobacillus bataviensis LMG 21833]